MSVGCVVLALERGVVVPKLVRRDARSVFVDCRSDAERACRAAQCGYGVALPPNDESRAATNERVRAAMADDVRCFGLLLVELAPPPPPPPPPAPPPPPLADSWCNSRGEIVPSARPPLSHTRRPHLKSH